jgi:hypothetical protein
MLAVIDSPVLAAELGTKGPYGPLVINAQHAPLAPTVPKVTSRYCGGIMIHEYPPTSTHCRLPSYVLIIVTICEQASRLTEETKKDKA